MTAPTIDEMIAFAKKPVESAWIHRPIFISKGGLEKLREKETQS